MKSVYVKSMMKMIKYQLYSSCISRATLHNDMLVIKAELQLEARPVIFKDIDCRLRPVCREVELPFVSPAFIGIPDGKADHSLEGLGPGFQPVQLSFVGFMLRTSGGVKSRKVYVAIVQFGATSPPCRFFRRGIGSHRS